MKKKPAQLELFAGRSEVHTLGLLGWEDALWTKPITIPLLGGEKLQTNLVTIRRLQSLPAAASPVLLARNGCSACESKPGCGAPGSQLSGKDATRKPPKS